MSTTLAALNAADARALTDRIKVGVEAVWELIKQAYTERAWDALGYSSWDDYCTREFGTSRLRLPREERAEILPSLRESGMSLRAIATATGLSKDTVQRELSGVSNETPERITGVNGVDQPASKPPRSEPTYRCVECGRTCCAIEAREPNAFMDGQFRCQDCVNPYVEDDEPDVDGTDPAASLCRDCDGYGCETCVPEDVADALNEHQAQGSALEALQRQINQAPQRKSPKPPITKTFGSATYELKRAVERTVRLADDDRFKKNKDQIADVNLSDLIRVRDAINGVIQQLEG